MHTKYEIPKYAIPESHRVVTEMLDDWLYEKFGFHFIVPIAKFETVPKVKPSFKELSKPLPAT